MSCGIKEKQGNIQKVIDILLDCDNDTLLIKVEQKGAACHTGSPTCFLSNCCRRKTAQNRCFNNI